MRALSDLMGTDDGLALLEERGVMTDPAAFAARLRPPADPGLGDRLGVASERPLVYVGQQVCADIGLGTAAKYRALRDLVAEHDVAPAVLWHDMDSARSERFGARIVVPGEKKTRGIWLVPRATVERSDVEPRFVPVERERLEAAFDALEEWAVGVRPGDVQAARSDVGRLRREVLDGEPETLGAVTRSLATALLRDALDLEAPSASASEMVEAGMLVGAIEEYIAARAEVVAVFNEVVESLGADGIDPQVRPLADDYLPLRFSCPDCATRLRLGAEVDGSALAATATCRCERRCSFDLGRAGEPSLDALCETGRWSPDVSMPVHHNDLASGWVGGRSTALYGLVFNEVLRRVLDREPVPILAAAGDRGDPDETLLVRLLSGRLPAAAG